jgi:hypothetical protein
MTIIIKAENVKKFKSIISFFKFSTDVFMFFHENGIFLSQMNDSEIAGAMCLINKSFFETYEQFDYLNKPFQFHTGYENETTPMCFTSLDLWKLIDRADNSKILEIIDADNEIHLISDSRKYKLKKISPDSANYRDFRSLEPFDDLILGDKIFVEKFIKDCGDIDKVIDEKISIEYDSKSGELLVYSNGIKCGFESTYKLNNKYNIDDSSNIYGSYVVVLIKKIYQLFDKVELSTSNESPLQFKGSTEDIKFMFFAAPRVADPDDCIYDD